jgi:hypothetical protein
LRPAVLRRTPSRAVDIEAWEVNSDSKVWAPAWMFLPRQNDPSKPVLLLLEPNGRNGRWHEGELYQNLAAQGGFDSFEIHAIGSPGTQQRIHVNGGVAPQNGSPDRTGQCTAPQLRRFIKSRPYVPMHELRRRFGIDGGDDDVTSVRLEPGWVYIGLPSREGTLLGDLLRAGEIGYELSLDPRSPIVIGVYPMRPIPRG